MFYSVEVKADDGQFIEMLQGEDINQLLSKAIDLKTKGFLGYYYEKKKLKATAGKDLAEYVSRDLRSQQDKETGLLEFSVQNKLSVKWDSLLREFEDNNPEPVSEGAVSKPVFEKLPPEPKPDDPYYQYKSNIKDDLIPFRRQKNKEALKHEFERDYRKWEKQKERVEARNRIRYDEFMESKKKLEERNSSKYKEWEKLKDQLNDDIKIYSDGYKSLDAEAVEKYCELIISRSDFRGMRIDRKPALRYVEDKKFLFIEFTLPKKSELIKVKEITFDADGEQFLEVEYTDSELEGRYVKVLQNIALKVIYEILSLDSADAINEINFRGIVKKEDRITDRSINIPVMTIAAPKEEFLSLNLTTETLQDCFELLGGIYTSHHLHEEPVILQPASTYQRVLQ